MKESTKMFYSAIISLVFGLVLGVVCYLMMDNLERIPMLFIILTLVGLGGFVFFLYQAISKKAKNL